MVRRVVGMGISCLYLETKASNTTRIDQNVRNYVNRELIKEYNKFNKHYTCTYS